MHAALLGGLRFCRFGFAPHPTISSRIDQSAWAWHHCGWHLSLWLPERAHISYCCSATCPSRASATDCCSTTLRSPSCVPECKPPLPTSTTPGRPTSWSAWQKKSRWGRKTRRAGRSDVCHAYNFAVALKRLNMAPFDSEEVKDRCEG